MMGRAQEVTNYVNRSARLLWRLQVGLAGLGLIDAIYLTYVKYIGASIACSGLGDCAAVNNSAYSQLAGIPIALIGALGYLTLLGLLLAEERWPVWDENFHYLQFGIALIGALYSVYLSYIEIAILRAVCPFCAFSAAMMVALFILSSIRLGEQAESLT
jgi:uncharacterized membrane protein